MTSSLVGSEMCIRDSDCTQRMYARGLGLSTVTPGKQLVPAPQQNPEPVSYTHLTLPTICSV
eukprot:1957039-Prorocentrum_lima.AAC.1